MWVGGATIQYRCEYCSNFEFFLRFWCVDSGWDDMGCLSESPPSTFVNETACALGALSWLYSRNAIVFKQNTYTYKENPNNSGLFAPPSRQKIVSQPTFFVTSLYRFCFFQAVKRRLNLSESSSGSQGHVVPMKADFKTPKQKRVKVLTPYSRPSSSMKKYTERSRY